MDLEQKAILADLAFASYSLSREDRNQCVAGRPLMGMAHVFQNGDFTIKAEHLTEAIISRATAYWYADGLRPATITERLRCLSDMRIRV